MESIIKNMKKTKMVSFTLKTKTIEDLNAYAAEFSINKSAFVDRLVNKELLNQAMHREKSEIKEGWSYSSMFALYMFKWADGTTTMFDGHSLIKDLKRQGFDEESKLSGQELADKLNKTNYIVS